MGMFTLNTIILRTPTGLLKILEIVLVLVCLLICRFGRDWYPFKIGSEGDHFLAVGTYVGFAIIVPAILFTYLLGANLTILELFTDVVGFALFLSAGIICIVNKKNAYRSEYNLGMALGILSIITAVVFLIDFLFAMKNTRITVVQTRAVAM